MGSYLRCCCAMEETSWSISRNSSIEYDKSELSPGVERCPHCTHPYEGDLSSCDNWRGISLLDVAGKVFIKTLQKRLQIVAEDDQLHTECGFRSNRGCIGMI